jgi:hypothetical protein
MKKFNYIKHLLLITTLAFSVGILKANPIAELRDLLYSAKNEGKCILIKVFDTDVATFYDSVFFSNSFSNRFLEKSLYASNPSDIAIINNYKVRTYPSIILLNSNGNLILPVKQINNFTEMANYVEQAYSMKEEYPIAQMDLDYQNNKMDKNAICEYIRKRTFLGLDNGDIIDNYALSASTDELLRKEILLLFLEQNNINIPGSFCDFLEQNQETIKNILKLSDERFSRLTDKAADHNFLKICKTQNESALNHIINWKIKLLPSENQDIIYNEYMTRYFYHTYQPLKLADHARACADAIFKHKKAEDEKKFSHRNKSLYTSPLSYSHTYVWYAGKLRNVAQYVVETLSVKSMLNRALAWSIAAEQLSNEKYDVFETQAYILYKLGKKDEAIDNMEKAYSMIPENNTEQKEAVGVNLIKMKRGEKVY